MHCCGNELCELGEDYGNCPADCLPTEIKIKVLEPDFDDYFVRGEEVLFKVQATSHGRKAILSDINITTDFMGPLRLYNDGKHDDDGVFDDIFAATFTVPVDLKPGDYNFVLDVNFKGVVDQIDYNFVLNPIIEVKLVLNDLYALGDDIKINFETYYKKKLAKNLALDVNVVGPSDNLLFEKSVTSSSGIYSPNYRTSLLEPSGKWTFTVSGTDDFNNTAFASRQVDVLKPGKHSFLVFEMLSPSDITFVRGKTVPMKIVLRDTFGSTIQGAFIQLFTPAGELILLDENTDANAVPGIYFKDFNLGFNEPAGGQKFKLEASKTQDLIELVGEKFVDLEIEPAPLDVEVLKPESFFFQAGDTLLVEIFVTYLEGVRVSGADVNLLLNSSPIEFKEVEPGVYQGTTVLTSDDVGRFTLDLNAADIYGNLGTADFEFEVSGMSLIRQLQVMSPVIILLLIALGIASFFAWQFYYRKASLASLRKEKKKVMALEKDLQKKYFEQNLLSRKEFNRTMEEYEDKLDKINNRMKELRKK
jgi:hypothetical protein